jgi:recombination associated protein RdgC
MKNAITYKAILPATNELNSALSSNAYKPITDLQATSTGFIPNAISEYLDDFSTIDSFKVRYDEKILPISVVNDETAKAIARIEQDESRVVGKKERSKIKESVYDMLLAKSHVKTTIIPMYYLYEHELLVLDTSSKKLADIAVNKLLDALPIGTANLKPVSVDKLDLQLTTALTEWVLGSVIINKITPFYLGGIVKLKGDYGSVSVNLTSVGNVPNTIKEAIEDKLVTEIEMGNDAMTFKLTKDFIFKGIKFTSEPQDETDPVHELTTQLLELRQAHSDLLKLFNSEN